MLNIPLRHRQGNKDSSQRPKITGIYIQPRVQKDAHSQRPQITTVYSQTGQKDTHSQRQNIPGIYVQPRIQKEKYSQRPQISTVYPQVRQKEQKRQLPGIYIQPRIQKEKNSQRPQITEIYIHSRIQKETDTPRPQIATIYSQPVQKEIHSQRQKIQKIPGIYFQPHIQKETYSQRPQIFATNIKPNTQEQNTRPQVIFDPYPHSIKSTTSKSITYCMMGTNRLHEIKGYIETVLPYIDRLIFIDGGSTDGTVEYLRSINSEGKIDVHTHQWQDKFSRQRNNYLKHFAEKQDDGWILVSDTDEHFPPDTLSKLKEAVANSGNYNGIKFKVEDITLDNDDREKILDKKVNEYWKGLLFKYHPKIHYEGEPHEALIGGIKWKRTDLIYQHTRSRRKVYERSCENFFISNSNRYSPKWAEFRFLCTKNDILKFDDFFKIYKEGTLPKDMEDWIYNHRDDNFNDGDSEVREMAKLYFEILHPDKRW